MGAARKAWVLQDRVTGAYLQPKAYVARNHTGPPSLGPTERFGPEGPSPRPINPTKTDAQLRAHVPRKTALRWGNFPDRENLILVT